FQLTCLCAGLFTLTVVVGYLQPYRPPPEWLVNSRWPYCVGELRSCGRGKGVISLWLGSSTGLFNALASVSNVQGWIFYFVAFRTYLVIANGLVLFTVYRRRILHP